MSIQRIAFVLAVCFASVLAGGDEYFVRIGGNDNADGRSAQTAWASLSKAVGAVKAGDVVYVGAGDHKGSIVPNKSGTAQQPIRFIADIKGEHTGDPGSVNLSGRNAIHIRNGVSYWEFVGFTLSAVPGHTPLEWDSGKGGLLENITINGGKDQIYVRNGGEFLMIGGSFSGANGYAIVVDSGQVEVRGASFTNNKDGAIYVKNSNAKADVYASVMLGGSIGLYSENGVASLENCVISGTDVGLRVRNSSARITALNCTITDTKFEGIIQEDGHLTVTNTLFSQIGRSAIDRKRSNSPYALSHNLYHNYAGQPVTQGDAGKGAVFGDPKLESLTVPKLGSGSAAIDAGDSQAAPGSDIAGAGRPRGGGADIGAYEYWGEALAVSLPYIDDFEGDIPKAWNGVKLVTMPVVGRALGRYARNEGVEVKAYTTPGVEYVVIFDLAIIDSWDGNNTQWGPDWFRVLADGNVIFEETFTRTGNNQTYPKGPDEMFPFTPNWGDEALYRNITVTFTAKQSITTIRFAGRNLQHLDDESWAIDYVRIMTPEDAVEYLPLFADATTEMGIGVETTGSIHDGSGIVVADFDGDGWPDIVMGGSSAKIAWNEQGEVFTIAQFVGESPRRQLVVADLDGDGMPDIWAPSIGSYDTEGAYLSREGRSFERRLDHGMEWPVSNEGAVAGDINLDGLCDIVMFSHNGNFIGYREGADEDHPVRFRMDNSIETGLNDISDRGNGDFASSADINGDGRPDIFYHFAGGRLFLSGDDGTYSRKNLGITAHTSNDHKFGSAWGDFNNNGRLDLFVPDPRPGHAGRLWRNDYDWETGVGGFVDVTDSAGLGHLTGAQRSAAWGDFDNDGYLDLYIVNAGENAGNTLLRNRGDGSFEEVGVHAGHRAPGDGHDAVFVDVDGDGRLDLIVTNAMGPARLLRNITASDKSLTVRVVGAGRGATNSLGVGVRIDLLDANGNFLQRRDIGGSRGMGAEPLWAHFGGVDPAGVYRVRAWLRRGPVEVEVTPQMVSTEFPGRTALRMLTIVEEEVAGRVRRVASWSEIGPDETRRVREGVRLIDRDEARRRGTMTPAEVLADLRKRGATSELLRDLEGG